MTSNSDLARLAKPFDRMLGKLAASIFISMMCYPAGAQPDASNSTSDTPIFSFSGFGTLGVVHSSEDRADFTASILKPNGAGHSRSWSAAVDSLMGGQVITNFTPQLSVMVQAIAQQNYDNTYSPHVEWANIKYQFTPDASFRIGRIVLASFLVSDTRNLGYANPWVRPPVEVYGLVPIDKSDGVDASYKLHIGQFLQTFVGTYGVTSSQQPAGGSAEARRQWNISDTVEYGFATVRIVYQRTNLTIDQLHTFVDAFRQFGPQGTALVGQYDPYRKPLEFMAIGGTYNPGDWFMTGEWGTSQSNSVLGESTAWYASGGMRFARFTPYLTYADVKANSNRSSPGLTVSALPPNLQVPAVGLNAGLNAILGSIAVQSTISVGVRWDFLKNADLKLQYNHTRLGAGSPGTLINLQPDFQPGGTVNLFSVAVDFVL